MSASAQRAPRATTTTATARRWSDLFDGMWLDVDQQALSMAVGVMRIYTYSSHVTPCLTDAGGQRRIGGSFGRVEPVGDQRERVAIVP
jgi:hypothetical protein